MTIEDAVASLCIEPMRGKDSQQSAMFTYVSAAVPTRPGPSQNPTRNGGRDRRADKCGGERDEQRWIVAARYLALPNGGFFFLTNPAVGLALI